MKASITLGFVALACLLAIAMATPATSATNTKKTSVTSPCLKTPPSKPSQKAPVDLSGSGLQFDPRAPGGAHPEEADEETILVDPATTTLFPPTATQPKLRGDSHEKSPPCRP